MATRQNLQFTMGETWEIVLNCADGYGNPFTPANVLFKIEFGATTLELEAANSQIVINGSQAIIEVDPGQQAGLTPGLYQYQVRAVKADGSISDQAFGSLYAQQGII